MKEQSYVAVKERAGDRPAASGPLDARDGDQGLLASARADVAAARAAGAAGILVLAPATMASDMRGVPCCRNLRAAVTAIPRGGVPPSRGYQG